jgi:hypothetical protein
MNKTALLLAGLAIMLLVTGCETTGSKIKTKTIKPIPTKIHKKVHVGDKVIITTRADKEYKLEVTQVTSEAVLGKSAMEKEKEVTVPFEQIKTIKLEKIVDTYRLDAVGRLLAQGLALIGLIAVLVLLGG